MSIAFYPFPSLVDGEEPSVTRAVSYMTGISSTHSGSPASLILKVQAVDGRIKNFDDPAALLTHIKVEALPYNSKELLLPIEALPALIDALNQLHEGIAGQATLPNLGD